MRRGKYQPAQLTFSWEELHVSPSPSPGTEADSKTREAGSCFRFLVSLNVSDLDGLSGRTSPVFCRATEDETLEPSSGRWGNWGMGGPTGCWTLDGSEFPKDAAASSLSAILETRPIPEKYFLSPKACAGILRRASKRGKELDTHLKAGLEAVVAELTSS